MQANTNIPEIVEQIGTYLDPPDLFKAIQLCRTWNKTLIPLLWDTIDDSLYLWRKILLKFETERRMNESYKGGTKWLKAIFGKYGYLVRELRVQRREILDVVAEMQCCLRLRTLIVGKMEPLGWQAVEHEWMYDLSQEEQLEMAELRWQDAMEDVVDSQFSQPAFRRRVLDLSSTTLAQQEVNWRATVGFWMMLRGNRGLRRLGMDGSLTGFMDFVSEQFFVETLALLPELVELENNIVQIDFSVVLFALPGLIQYTNLTHAAGSILLSHPALRLTHVDLGQRVTCQLFLCFLRKAPSLESLRILMLSPSQPKCSRSEAASLMENTPSRLSRLQLDFVEDNDVDMLDILLPWIPHLTTIHLAQLFPKVATAFSTHCSGLTTIEGTNTGPLTQLAPGRWRHNPQGGTLETMIMSCTKLRKIDWIGRTLCDTYIWTAASGSCWPNLTYLRCQIGNQFTMTQLSAIIWKRIKGVMGPFGYQETRVIVERQSVGARQTKVLQKLGSLIHLRVLDIGADFRYGVQVGDGNDGGTVVEFDETGLDERPMMHNCLKLSLDMGLGALSTLKDLEVFGFEGIEHEIDEMEIEWMAEHWPKLKVMRGLFGTLLPTTEEETKRAHLHSIMRDLRPDVIHEASDVCLMVPLA